ncbi:MAG: hypothetical protein P4L74_07280 [Candidatus Doudnabacteria bacterium]|nr:hypothetical protein [Candidatus Doudnabacteria bacterium]
MFPLQGIRPVCQVANEEHEVSFMILAAHAVKMGMTPEIKLEYAVMQLNRAAIKLPEDTQLIRCNQHADGIRLTLQQGDVFSRFEDTVEVFLQRFYHFDNAA